MTEGRLLLVYVVAGENSKGLDVYGVFHTEAEAQDYFKTEILPSAQPHVSVVSHHAFQAANEPDSVTLVDVLGKYQIQAYEGESVRLERTLHRKIWEKLTEEERQHLRLSPPV